MLIVLTYDIKYRILKRLRFEYPSLVSMIQGKYDYSIGSRVSSEDFLYDSYGQKTSDYVTSLTLLGTYIIWGEVSFRNFVIHLGKDPDIILSLIKNYEIESAFEVISDLAKEKQTYWNTYLDCLKPYNQIISEFVVFSLRYGNTELSDLRNYAISEMFLMNKAALRIVPSFIQEYNEWKFMNIAKGRELKDLLILKNEVNENVLQGKSKDKELANILFKQYYTTYDNYKIGYYDFSLLYALDRKAFYRGVIRCPYSFELMKDYKEKYGNDTAFDTSIFLYEQDPNLDYRNVDQYYMWEDCLNIWLNKHKAEAYRSLQKLYRNLVNDGFIKDSRESLFVYRFSGLYYHKEDLDEKINWTYEENALWCLITELHLGRGRYRKMCSFFKVNNTDITYNPQKRYQNGLRINGKIRNKLHKIISSCFNSRYDELRKSKG